MIRERISALTAVCLFVLAVGCSVSGPENPPPSVDWVDFSKFATDTTELVGEWTWVRTRCCDKNLKVVTPKTTKKNQSLVFEENGTVEFYQNEVLEEQTTYKDYLHRAQWGLRGDTLAISWAHLDGPESVYVRDANVNLGTTR